MCGSVALFVIVTASLGVEYVAASLLRCAHTRTHTHTHAMHFADVLQLQVGMRVFQRPLLADWPLSCALSWARVQCSCCVWQAYRLWLVSPKGSRYMRVQRYSALRTLHDKLLEAHTEDMKALNTVFPPKSLFKGAKLLETRKKQLDVYVGHIIRDAVVGGSIVLRLFLDITDGAVLYKTLSSCPVCTIIEKKGINWIGAEVLEHDGRVYAIPKFRCCLQAILKKGAQY